MPNERRYSNELNLESVGINLPYNMQAEQSVLGAVLLKPETLTDLVEIIPDALPNKGETVDVRNYSNDETITCLVVSVTRNSRTVEIVVRTPDGEAHTLVMEGR